MHNSSSTNAYALILRPLLAVISGICKMKKPTFDKYDQYNQLDEVCEYCLSVISLNSQSTSCVCVNIGTSVNSKHETFCRS